MLKAGTMVKPWLLTGLLLSASVLSPSVSSDDSLSEDGLSIGKGAARPMLGDWGVETKYFSKTVSPQDDFYHYVNEGWLNTVEIPQGFPLIGSFTEVYLRSEIQVRAILDDIEAGKTDKLTGGSQIHGVYDSYMNEDRIEKLGLSPIQAELDAVMKASTPADIARWMAKPMHDSAIYMGVVLDEKNPERYTLMASQSGLGLPDRTYYLDDGDVYTQFRRDYTDYITGVFSRAGIDKAEQRADDILAFETAIAKLHWTPEEERDRIKNYDPMSKAELLAYAPGFDWLAMMEEMGVSQANQVVVSTNTAVQGIAELMGKTPINVLQSYLAFHLIDNYSPLLSSDYAEAGFDFYSRKLSGVKEMRPRVLRAQAFVNRNLGEVLGRMYVDRYFPAENKVAMEKYIGYLREAFRQRLQQSEWMDDQTRKEAFDKLDKFVAKVGYPDKWRDFSSIEIKSDDLVGNKRRISEWYRADMQAKLNEPRRKWEWHMSPQEINAYYSSSSNEIVFPAAVLQAPFFDPAADPAVNFAAIGAVIGHEMSHGFDDQGSLSDGNGVLRDWWTPEARKSFEQRTKVLVEQYNEYEPIKGLHVSGQLTLGENIGDFGGVAVAYTAYQKYLEDEHGGKAPVIDGFTGDQRFFMSWAQLWRTKQTESLLRQRVLSDPHSPGEYRVNGVLRNNDAWYDAFSVKSEDKLYLAPEKRAHIW